MKITIKEGVADVSITESGVTTIVVPNSLDLSNMVISRERKVLNITIGTVEYIKDEKIVMNTVDIQGVGSYVRVDLP